MYSSVGLARKLKELHVVLANVDGVHLSPEFLLAKAWNTRFEFSNSRKLFACLAMANAIELHLLAAIRLP
jgi:hypothetical protein